MATDERHPPLLLGRSPRRRAARGFSLLETMIGLAVLAAGMFGVVIALLSSAKELRDGQLLQQRSALVDAAFERIRLEPKANLLLAANNTGAVSTSPKDAAIGEAPWAVDPAPASGDDLGTGAYFRVHANGEIIPATDVAAGTECTDVPADVLCREIAVHTGGPPDATMTFPSDAKPISYWVRISRPGDSVGRETVTRMEVLVQ